MIAETYTKQTTERAYSLATTAEYRKKHGQFFTPKPVADLMAQWVTAGKHLDRVLDPAIGLGILIESIQQISPDCRATGFDTDPTILTWAKRRLSPDSQLRCQNYLFGDWEERFDAIIANPPYFRFHDYDNKSAIDEIQRRLGIKLSGFTNLYSLFLLKALSQLAEGGRAAFLIPSEFMNADYGVGIKDFLVKHRSLRTIITIDFEENLFDDALTTACLLFFENDGQSKGITFTNIQSVDDITTLSRALLLHTEVPDQLFVQYENLDPSVKWRAYYQKQQAVGFKNLVPFSQVGKVVRGIATGANEYFMFNPTKATEWSIPGKNLLPCVAKSADIKTSFFTNESYSQLRLQDKTIWIFNAGAATDEPIKRYLKKGEKEGIDKKFLTASRNPWYSLENRPPAPIWVTVFNRNGLRFIRNETQTRNLTTFHCVYLNMFNEKRVDLIMAYLLTDVAKEIFSDNRREYGNGLQKFEPNDLNKAMMADLDQLPSAIIDEILIVYRQYRLSCIELNPVEPLRLLLDQLFRQFYIA